MARSRDLNRRIIQVAWWLASRTWATGHHRRGCSHLPLASEIKCICLCNDCAMHCNDHVTRAVKPRDVNKRAWMACASDRYDNTRFPTFTDPCFQFLPSACLTPIIICCSLYFLERALSLLFFSDSLRLSLRRAIVRGCAGVRSAMFVYISTW